MGLGRPGVCAQRHEEAELARLGRVREVHHARAAPVPGDREPVLVRRLPEDVAGAARVVGHLCRLVRLGRDVEDAGLVGAPPLHQPCGRVEAVEVHGAEPNHKRDVLIVTDEYGGGTGVGACGGQQGDATGATPLVPGQAGSAGVGAVHFYRLDPATGLVQRGGTDKAGIFNIPAEANEPAQVADDAGCTSHVFWQAPDQNRFTIAWYGRGTRVVDFSDPAKPRQLGFFVPLGANTWSAKPHRGFIFSGDMARGLDVLRYRGESCDRWPTTSGSAEDQRAETQRGGAGTRKPGSSPTRGPSPRKFTGPCKPFTTAQARAASRRLVISRSTRRSGNRKAPVVVRCRSAVSYTHL